ncbi:peptidoglycan bridge formation glycyltransferase FemA/FemB family protein [Candidatus Woesebacteria bacterium]|nr:peptidoglycan bridge formation glycyltransferase FemA/FemB family protein [Candidatus Woesebacteria bacterium]
MNDLISRFKSRLDLHQSPAHAEVMKKIGWSVDGKPGNHIYYRSLGPLTVAKHQRPNEIDVERLKVFRKHHKVLTTYVEPGLGDTYDGGYPVEPFAHSTSSLVDLAQSGSALLMSYTQKTRYNITHSLKANKVNIISTPLPKLKNQELSDFYALHAEWSKRKNVIGYSRDLLEAVLTSFDKKSTLHLAYDAQGTPHGALLILTCDRVSTYYAAFSSTTGYSLYVPTLLTHQAMLTAKDNGSDIFDFGGTYDPRYPRMYKKWHGFTKFKEGFNPTTIQYPPTKLHLFW